MTRMTTLTSAVCQRTSTNASRTMTRRNESGKTFPNISNWMRTAELWCAGIHSAELWCAGIHSAELWCAGIHSALRNTWEKWKVPCVFEHENLVIMKFIIVNNFCKKKFFAFQNLLLKCLYILVFFKYFKSLP